MKRWQPWSPDDSMPRLNKGLVYLGACVIAGLRLARMQQVNVRTIPVSAAIDESISVAFEMFYAVFKRAAREVRDEEASAAD